MKNSPEPSQAPTSTSSSPKKRHGFHSAEGTAIDERPQEKDSSSAVRCAMSSNLMPCTGDVGVNDLFLRSLSLSANWAAEGGKSKSNFWKTSDDCFIIKTFVNAWNALICKLLRVLSVSLGDWTSFFSQVLIENGPSYFRYIELRPEYQQDL